MKLLVPGGGLESPLDCSTRILSAICRYPAPPCTTLHSLDKSHVMNEMVSLSTPHLVAQRRTKYRYKVAPKAAPDCVHHDSRYGLKAFAAASLKGAVSLKAAWTNERIKRHLRRRSRRQNPLHKSMRTLVLADHKRRNYLDPFCAFSNMRRNRSCTTETVRRSPFASPPVTRSRCANICCRRAFRFGLDTWFIISRVRSKNFDEYWLARP